MARAYPVPNYSTKTAVGTSLQRKLSTASPGTTDSTATVGLPVGLAGNGISYYLAPETTATQQTLKPVGTASGIGWGLVPSDPGTLVPLSTDGFALSAGTITATVYAIRDTAITSTDITMTFTIVIFRATAGAASFPQELGRYAAASVVVSTNKVSFNFVVSVVAATFNPGDILWLEVFVGTTATAAPATTPSFHTNSTTSLGITASTCTYTTQYNRTLSDSVAVSDTMARKFTGSRALLDAAPISDTLARAATRPRALSDAVPIADTLTRQFVAVRALSDAMPVADTLARSYTGSRTLTDSVAVTDTLACKTTYARTLTDALATGGGGTTVVTKNFRPIYIIED